MSATQFAWSVLGNAPFPPPGDFAPDDPCWLCGGPTNGFGWMRTAWLTPTFTNHNLAAVLSSRAVCQPCVALSSKSTWDEYVAAHPEMGLKTGHAMSWRFYSHVFAAGLHDCPSRERWRQWLLDPPEPPFVFCVSTSGQKHLLFRCRVAGSRDLFPVQFEDERILVRRTAFAGCLADFEEGLAAGLRRDDLLTGRYNSRQSLNAGLARWRDLEYRLERWRRMEPGLLRLAHRFAAKTELNEVKEETICITDLIPKTSAPQLALF